MNNYTKALVANEIQRHWRKTQLGEVLVKLPSLDEAGVIALKIAEVAGDLTDSQTAIFIGGFQECIKYLDGDNK